MREDRKPLILRGARQVGKTTVVEMFRAEVPRALHVDCERPGHAALFRRGLSAADLVQAMALLPGQPTPRGDGPTLLFIDEIQACPEALLALRFLYEDLPACRVVAAGSLLEAALGQAQISMPVGRVEYLAIHPVTFAEFLEATGARDALAAYLQTPCPDFAVPALQQAFRRWCLIGGMPEAVARAAAGAGPADLAPWYDHLLTAYRDDLVKYARRGLLEQVVRHCMAAAPLEAGQRITLAGFGGSSYRAREVGEALRLLEQAHLVRICYPVTATQLPATPGLHKHPRLQFLDTGLMNAALGLQGQVLTADDLADVHQGRMIEHAVGQELLGREDTVGAKPWFWIRDKPQAQAEVDFVIPWQGRLVAVEVKKGAQGRLRSLHQFVDQQAAHTSTPVAIRLYNGVVRADHLKTVGGTAFILLNLPYACAARIPEHLEAWQAGGLGA